MGSRLDEAVKRDLARLKAESEQGDGDTSSLLPSRSLPGANANDQALAELVRKEKLRQTRIGQTMSGVEVEEIARQMAHNEGVSKPLSRMEQAAENIRQFSPDQTAQNKGMRR